MQGRFGPQPSLLKIETAFLGFRSHRFCQSSSCGFDQFVQICGTTTLTVLWRNRAKLISKTVTRTLKESCNGLGSVSLKINNQHTHSPPNSPKAYFAHSPLPTTVTTTILTVCIQAATFLFVPGDLRANFPRPTVWPSHFWFRDEGLWGDLLKSKCNSAFLHLFKNLWDTFLLLFRARFV